MNRLIKYTLGIFLITVLWGFGSSHSQVHTTISNQDQNLSIIFSVKANEDMEITQQAPWSLTIINPKDIDRSEEGDIKITGYDEKVSGFTFQPKIKPNINEGSFDYVLKAFVCTKDKKRCYPQTHRGTIKWSLKQKAQIK